MPEKNAPILAAEFSAMMQDFLPLPQNRKIAAAVSGGSDSMALCLLLQDWCTENNAHLTALTIDHGLRAESAQEALQTGEWLRQSGVDHAVLTLQGEKPKSRLQQFARKARYALLQDYCRRQEISDLYLAHHQDDQIETFWLRLLHGSGLYGLSGMEQMRHHRGLRLLRPLLNIPKSRLKETLRQRGQVWIEDPSNRNPIFGRTRLRLALPRLAQMGWEEDKVIKTLQVLQKNRAALKQTVDRLSTSALRIFPEGYALLALDSLQKSDAETGKRLLAQILAAIGGREYGPRGRSLDLLYRQIMDEDFKMRTLNGCILQKQDGDILICREFGRIQSRMPLMAKGGIWDGRFILPQMDRAQEDFYIAALSEKGWAQIVQHRPELRSTEIPLAARYALPAIWLKKDGVDFVVAAPHLNYWRQETKSCSWYGIMPVFSPGYDVFLPPISGDAA